MKMMLIGLGKFEGQNLSPGDHELQLPGRSSARSCEVCQVPHRGRHRRRQRPTRRLIRAVAARFEEREKELLVLAKA
jgi:hypothetical protein